MIDVREPTTEECSAHTVVYQDATVVGYAIWYPQMGGYVGKAVALIERQGVNDCFDVLVWHDGEFPFLGLERTGAPPLPGEDRHGPAELHHCSAAQFIEFGETIDTLMERLQEPSKKSEEE